MTQSTIDKIETVVKEAAAHYRETLTKSDEMKAKHGWDIGSMERGATLTAMGNDVTDLLLKEYRALFEEQNNPA